MQRKDTPAGDRGRLVLLWYFQGTKFVVALFIKTIVV